MKSLITRGDRGKQPAQNHRGNKVSRYNYEARKQWTKQRAQTGLQKNRNPNSVMGINRAGRKVAEDFAK